MAALGSLSAIARQRPAFMAIVVQAFESLHGRSWSMIFSFDFNLINWNFINNCSRKAIGFQRPAKVFSRAELL